VTRRFVACVGCQRRLIDTRTVVPSLFCRDDVRRYTPTPSPPIARKGKAFVAETCTYTFAVSPTATRRRPGASRALPGSCAHQLRNSGLIACLVALASGTLGTVYQRRHGDRIALVWATAVQYAAAAAVLLAVTVATEDVSLGAAAGPIRGVAGGLTGAEPMLADGMT
jgi:hypothetical protein